MRLGRIASIVIISTGVAAPTPGPTGDVVRPVIDHGSMARSVTHPAKTATPNHNSRLAAADVAVPPQRGVQMAAKSDVVLRRSVEDKPEERPAPKAVAAVQGAPAAATVQLGAFTSETAALAAWAKIRANSDGLLNGLTPVAVPVPAKAHLWRLRTTVSDQPAARSLCAALVARKLVCVVAKD